MNYPKFILSTSVPLIQLNDTGRSAESNVKTELSGKSLSVSTADVKSNKWFTTVKTHNTNKNMTDLQADQSTTLAKVALRPVG